MTGPSTSKPGSENLAATRSSSVLLAVYLLTLLWLTLFKLSYDIPQILVEHRTRSLNLIPFRGLGPTGWSETVSNLVVFIPFGLLLSLNFKTTARWRLPIVVVVFSAAVETLQYLLAIGTSDATDVVMNTLGGLTGILLYRLTNKGMTTKTLDRVIEAAGTVVLVAFMLLRLLVFKVRY
jgi:glycopeptide antibiotics resistance protein